MSRSPSPTQSEKRAESLDEEQPPNEESANVVESDKTTYDNRTFILAFQKSVYTVPNECVKFDGRTPIQANSGDAAYKLHESKSFPAWKAQVMPKHIVQLQVGEAGGEVQVGWYITFKIGSTDSADIYTLRPVHKTVAIKFYSEWNDAGLSEKKKVKYSNLLAKEPSQTAQINPERQRWSVVETPPDMLYRRPKKESAKSAKREREEEDDAASSATTNKGALALAPQHNRKEEQDSGVSGFGSGTQIFMQTPGNAPGCYCNPLPLHFSLAYNSPFFRRHGNRLRELPALPHREPAALGNLPRTLRLKQAACRLSTASPPTTLPARSSRSHACS
jgi:hypothetical protein